MPADGGVPDRKGSQAWVIYLWEVQEGAREDIKTSMKCTSPIRHIAQGDKQGYTRRPSYLPPYQNTLLVLAQLIRLEDHRTPFVFTVYYNLICKHMIAI